MSLPAILVIYVLCPICVGLATYMLMLLLRNKEAWKFGLAGAGYAEFACVVLTVGIYAIDVLA